MPKTFTAGIVGTGSYLPEKILDNAYFEKTVDTTDEWIFSRTGIKERRMVPPNTATSDLALEASKKALDMAGLKPEDVDIIVAGTITPDYRFPSTACILQHKLGCRNIAAFDISAACCGFVDSVSIVTKFLDNKEYKVGLAIGAEVLTSVTNYEDRSSCILFGDGAGAAVLHADAPGGHILNTFMGSDGEGGDFMIVPSSGSANPVTAETVARKEHLMVIRGKEVYKTAVSRVGQVVKEACERGGYTVDDLAMIIPHQMNMRIIEGSSKRLGTPLDKWYANIEKVGNTSAATIPIALDEIVRGNKLNKGDLAAFTAFGGGITWAGGLMRW